MTARSALSVVVASSVLCAAWPRPAHADEPPAVVASDVPRIFLSPSEVARIGAPQVSFATNAASLHEIRLSREAKTWIIVGAIVGGILLTVGVIVIAVKPGRFG